MKFSMVFKAKSKYICNALLNMGKHQIKKDKSLAEEGSNVT